MREPFSRLLSSDEPLLAAREVVLGTDTGPLAVPAEMLVFVSPVLSIILAIRLDGFAAKALGALLPPLITFLLARYVLRGWRRPRQWLGLTRRRLLIWRRPAAIFAGPRIEEVPLADIYEASIGQDDWDARAGLHQLTIQLEHRARNLGRIAAAPDFLDTLIATLGRSPPPPPPSPPPPPRPSDFIPPAGRPPPSTG